MAGYKGAGLALILGLLGGTLNGALFGRDCVDFNAEPDKVTNTGQFILALDRQALPAIRAIQCRSRPPYPRAAQFEVAAGAGAGAAAGRTARQTPRRASAQGLPLPPELIAQLDKLAADLAIKPLGAR